MTVRTGASATRAGGAAPTVLVAVLLGVGLLVAAVALVVLMVQQPALTPVPVPTVSIT